MDNRYCIYVEQLRGGASDDIDEILDPDFLDIHEKDLTCNAPVKIVGEAYLADSELVIHLTTVATEVLIPCSICNSLVTVPIVLRDLYHSEPLSEITTGIYDYREMLRESLLLEVPHFTECGGSCPTRKEIAQYLYHERGAEEKHMK